MDREVLRGCFVTGIALSLWFLPVRASVLSAELYFTRDSINPLQYTAYLKCYTLYKPLTGLDSVYINWGDNTDGRIFLTQVDSINPKLFAQVFTGNHTYLASTQTITMSVWWWSRVDGIVNYLSESDLISMCVVAETNVANMQIDASPVFTKAPDWLSTNSQPYIAALPVSDANGDSIVYEAMVSLQDTDSQVPLYSYPNVAFSGPGAYTYAISSVSGVISWVSPYYIGIYNVAVRVKEYRNGVFIGSVMRDFNIYIDAPSGVGEKSIAKNEVIQIVAEGQFLGSMQIPANGVTRALLFDLSGQLTKEITIVNNEADVTGVLPGMYLLMVQNEENRVVKKFVKQ